MADNYMTSKAPMDAIFMPFDYLKTDCFGLKFYRLISHDHYSPSWLNNPEELGYALV